MFCTNCGAPNQNSARFCINCAQSLIEVQIERRFARPGLRKVDSLFNFSFSRFLSPSMMKFLYILSILFAGLLAAFLIIAAFKASLWMGIFMLLFGSPLIILLITISSRVLLETILMIFRIAEQMAHIGVANIDLAAREEESESRDNIQWNI